MDALNWQQPISAENSDTLAKQEAVPKSGRTLSLADLADWRERGLITRDQLGDILAYLGTENSVIPAKRTRRVPGLNLVNIAYYFGGFMVLLAFTFLLGTQWIDAGKGGQIALAAIAISVPLSIGIILRRATFTTPGNLLVFAATGIVPLLVYTIEQRLGVWHDEPRRYHSFFEDVLPAWVVMELIGIAAAGIAVRWTRFPLITLLIAFWTWYLSMDLVRWISRSDGRDIGADSERLMSLAIGAAMVAAGIALQRRTERDYSLWVYLFGHLIVFCSLSALALDHQGLLGWLVYPAVYIGIVALSVWTQRKVFLVFGALGTYSWATYLVFDTFDGAIGISLGLAVIGIGIVLSGVIYRNTIEPCLADRVKPRCDAQPLPAS